MGKELLSVLVRLEWEAGGQLECVHNVTFEQPILLKCASRHHLQKCLQLSAWTF